ncbi:MAG TPA: hypothetical protein VGX76_08150, partial [Pirellulales bacterium]|nr:hypothetical protein [Pirellulales bacterium]
FGGGGFGGFGGFGAQDGVAGTFRLVTNAAVQKDLAMTQDQIDKIKKLDESYQEDAEAGRPEFNFQEVQNLSDEERGAKMQEFRDAMAAQTKKLTEKYQPKLEKTLDNAQLARIKQIQRQQTGIMALRDKETIKDLGLSDEQVEQIEAIFNEDRNARLMAVLSDEQKAKLDELKGKPFDMAQLRPRFGGPGGPGGAGGGGGGGGGGRGGAGGRPGGRERPPM